MNADIYAELYVCDSCGSVECELNYGEDCQNCESGKLKVADFVPQSEVTTLRTRITEQDARIAALESAEFWNNWVYPKGATPEQIQNELHDYREIMKNVSKVYMHITGGKLSKPSYDADVIISEFESHVQRLIEEAQKDEDE